MPLSETACFPPNAASLVKVNVPEKGPALGGVAVTETVQVPLGGMGVVQLFVATEKFVDAVTVPGFIAAFPIF